MDSTQHKGIGYAGPQKPVESSTSYLTFDLVKQHTFTIDPGVHGYLYLLLAIFMLVVILIACTRCLKPDYHSARTSSLVIRSCGSQDSFQCHYVLVNSQLDVSEISHGPSSKTDVSDI